MKTNRIIHIGTAVVFFICLISAYYLNSSLAPDEGMRLVIPNFILNHGYLPRGDESEILDSIWGFSYGFSPYLPSLISVFFMKLVMIFTNNTQILLLAARMVSVLSVAGTFFVCGKIGQEIFEKNISIIMFSVLCCFLPQYIFIGSYLNNDAMSVFSTAVIIYFWIRGIKTNWQIKCCIGLGIGLGICALTYYNAYGFILMSIFVFVISAFKLDNSFSVIIKKGLIIFFIAFAIGGWFFIRNAIIHEGDFLGMNTMYACGEKYATDMYKPSLRKTPHNLGLSFLDTFFTAGNKSIPGLENTNWFVGTIKSFIAVFGYMEFSASGIVYFIYCLIFGIGFIVGIKVLFFDEKIKKVPNIIAISLIMCIIIPFCLSMYYSYFVDMQAQGRYVMSSLLPIMLIVTIGYEEISNKFKKYFNFEYVIILIYVIMFIYIFINIYAKNCFI